MWPIILLISPLTNLTDPHLKLPEPTAQVRSLIATLGDKRHEIREKADNELRALGKDAVRGVLEAIQSPNPEISFRAKMIYTSYFSIAPEKGDYPGIWHIDETIRFPEGFSIEKNKLDFMGSTCVLTTKRDIAQEYYVLALNEMDDFKKNGYSYLGWQNTRVAKHAMHLYCRHRLLQGHAKDELKKVINTAADNTAKYHHYAQVNDLHGFYCDYLPPGPMIPKEEYQKPYYQDY